MDMFASIFKANGIMSKEAGAKYRKYILRPGATDDAENLLRNFLGRDPTPDAFLESKGI